MGATPGPRLAPSTISRTRVQNWLQRHENVPLRLIAAPPGSGKTTAAIHYLDALKSASAYCILPERCSTTEFRSRLAQALRITPVPRSYAQLLEALRAAAKRPVVITVDQLDGASEEALADLLGLVNDAPDTVKLIYIARSRSVLDVGRMLAQGVAALCDTSILDFDAAETRQLCEALQVSYGHTDIVRLLDASEGWAIVVSACSRRAAMDQVSLAGAFENWRRLEGRLFEDFIGEALRAASEDERAVLRSIVNGAACEDEVRLRRLEARGLFVRADGYGLRPYRTLMLLRNPAMSASPVKRNDLPPMKVTMFGRWSATINERAVPWMRRRDQEVFKYLLLTEHGTASRGTLVDQFWPDADPQLAHQSLRTVCSNIRKALSTIVGYDNVDYFFQAGDHVRVDFRNVTVDAKRFEAHVTDGELAQKKGDDATALHHFRAAEALYKAPLLAGDVTEAWVMPHVARYEQQLLSVLERVAMQCRIQKEYSLAATYARRALLQKQQGGRLVSAAVSA